MESLGVMIVSRSPFQEKTRILLFTVNDFMIVASSFPSAFMIRYLSEFFRARFIKLSVSASEILMKGAFLLVFA